MAHPNEQLQDELSQSLRKDGKGWDIRLFEDQIKITTFLCHHCRSVCNDAVELSCHHNDNDIFVYCNDCLCDLIQDNDNKCPINKHNSPIIAPLRALRRQISQSMIICPYCIQYKQQKQSLLKDDANNQQQIMDTINNMEGKEEGLMEDDHGSGCLWKGTLNDLLTSDHFNQCTMRYNPSFGKDLIIRKLQEKVQDPDKQIQQQIKLSTELKIKLDLVIEKN